MNIPHFNKPTKTTIAVASVVLFIVLFFLVFWGEAEAHGHMNYNYNHAVEAEVNASGGGQSSGNSSDGESRRGIANALCLGMTNFDYDRGGQVSGGGSWWQDENSGCIAYGTMVDEWLIVGGGACDVDFEDCGGAVTFSTHVF